MKKLSIVFVLFLVLGFGFHYANSALVTNDDGTVTDTSVVVDDSGDVTTDPALDRPTTSPNFVKVLALRSSGPEVEVVQQMLANLGYDLRLIDGKFGTKTRSAVKAFQTANGLKSDGIIGEDTFALLESQAPASGSSTGSTGSGSTDNTNTSVVIPPVVTPPVATNTTTTSPNFVKVLALRSSGPEVEVVQQMLANLGYDLRLIDGKFGTKTRSAVKAFQTANGLKSDGIIGEDTFALLESQSLVNNTTSNASTNTNNTVNTNNDASTSVSVPSGFQTLSRNDSGPLVEELQRMLLANGYTSVGRVDGKFGYNTWIAVKQYQTANGLTVDGFVNESMFEMLTKETNAMFSSTNTEENNTNTNTNTNNTNTNNPNTDPNSSNNSSNSSQSSETWSFVKKSNANKLFDKYSCKEAGGEKLFVWNGETIDETKNSIYRLADVWSTTDGINWKQEAKDTKIGERWEPMIVKVDDTVYSFGGKYKENSSASDNAVYKSKDLVNWTYVGDIPEMDHNYDRSVVYFKDKFWLIGSDSGDEGVWSSSDGKDWTQVLTKTPWNGEGLDRWYNSKGRYDSNSVGAYVINNKMWYIVMNNKKGAGLNGYNHIMQLYSTSDGKNWTDEGPLVNKATNAYFDFYTNINPAPVVMDGKVWVVAYSRGTNSLIVINSSNGKDWYVASDNSSYVGTLPRFYPSVATFMGKLWTIGGWDLKGVNNNGNDIWASSDGKTWTQMTPKGVKFPGPADRWLASIVSIGKSSPKASNLEIEREYNVSSFFNSTMGSSQTDILGQWKLIANPEKDKSNTGSISISELSFVGHTYKTSTNDEFSTLEKMTNLIVYIDNVKVGSISKFNGPFFESSGSKHALPQTIKLDQPYVLKTNDEVWVKLVADFKTPMYKMAEYRTFLNGIGFTDAESTPCEVYIKDTSGGDETVPGRNIYYKDR